jgi:hypothetical protein
VCVGFTIGASVTLPRMLRETQQVSVSTMGGKTNRIGMTFYRKISIITVL